MKIVTAALLFALSFPVFAERATLTFPDGEKIELTGTSKQDVTEKAEAIKRAHERKRHRELVKKYGVGGFSLLDDGSVLVGRSGHQHQRQRVFQNFNWAAFGAALRNAPPEPSLTEKMDQIYGHDHTHSHRPASGLYIDGGSYLIGPDFWCSKSGNVTICN